MFNVSNSSHVSIRPACSDDLEQMLETEKMCYPEPWSADHFITEMQKKYARIWVLTDDETDCVVVGYSVFWLQAEGASLLNVCVNPKWWGLKFGEKLIRAMINEVVREEIPKISLEVREGNTNAIQFYEHLGFKKMHERKRFYQDGETAWVMEIKTSDIHPGIH
jgi:ribosomal-protein-alanine N-acetyltransferase